MSGCRVRVWWWDCDLEVLCVLDAGHDGPHSDGVRWFDADGFQVPRSPQRHGYSPRVHPAGCVCDRCLDKRARMAIAQRNRYARERARTLGRRVSSLQRSG